RPRRRSPSLSEPPCPPAPHRKTPPAPPDPPAGAALLGLSLGDQVVAVQDREDPRDLRGVVEEVRRKPDAPLPRSGNDVVLLEALGDDAGVRAGEGRGEDPGAQRLGRADPPASLEEPALQDLAGREDPRADGLDAHL